jgi:hypothetical protein
MGCNCKTEEAEYNGEKISLGKSIVKYAFKVSVFLLSLMLLPIILVASIWLMFDMLVLSKQFDTKGVIMTLAKIFKTKNDDDDDDDDDEYYDDYEEDEYEMVDVEVITNDIK